MQDALGAQTVVTIDCGSELFSLSGTVIKSRGFLDVYPWIKWEGKALPLG
jgi:DNA topoisomerase IA